MPLVRRVPKFGFNNPTRVEYKGINLDTLQALAENKGIDTIDPGVLYANGLIAKKDRLKVLGRGEVKGALKISAHAFSAAATKAIEAKGGSVQVIDIVAAKKA
jgi:large subunit ribosomal protein L15